MMNKYRCKACDTEGLYADGSRICPVCGGELVKTADGAKAARRCIRHGAWFVEGILSTVLAIALANADLYDRGSVAVCVFLAALIVAVAPFTRIRKRKVKEERKASCAR